MPRLKRIQKGYKVRTQVMELQVTYADLTESDGSQSFDFATDLPEDHVVLGVHFDVTTEFTDGSTGAFDGDLGISAGDLDYWIDGADIDGATGKMVDTAGAAIMPSTTSGAVTPAVTINADVNVDTATAGDLTARIYYQDLTSVE